MVGYDASPIGRQPERTRVKRGKLYILLVEDDDPDIFFVKRATEAENGHEVQAVHDGNEAIGYLRGEGKYADRGKYHLPNVILTDLKMPGMDGFAFLEWLRANPQHSIVPVVVYSNSHMERDVREAYRLGANAYIAKPSALKDMVHMLRLIYEFWSRCEIPSGRRE